MRAALWEIWKRIFCGAYLRELFEAWIARRHRPQRSPIRLHRQRIYILPTGYGYGFAAMLIVMLLWAINYNNSMGFVLTFLLIGVALNSMWRTNNGLLDLQVHPAITEPQFAGQEARFMYRIENPEPRARYGIALQWNGQAPQYADIPANDFVDIVLLIPARRRGVLRPGRLRVLTRFPLGLFQAWSWVEFDQGCLIYPKPWGKRPLPGGFTAHGSGGMQEAGMGSEDYLGLRSYAPGDSPRRVAWKATAREEGLLVKHFSGQASPELWLDWNGLAPDNVEMRLSQLCLWVLKAEAEERCYGLQLPGVEFRPGRGEKHRQRCLATLASFGFSGLGVEDLG